MTASPEGAEAPAAGALARRLAAARGGSFIGRTAFRRREVRFERAREAARRVAGLLAASGVEPGEHVVVWGTSGPEWAVAFLGAIWRGAVTVPLDDLAGAAFARRVAEQVRPRVAFVGASSWDAARQALPEARLVPLDDLLDRVEDVAPQPEPYPAPPGHPLQVVFTSGTTSDPKGVVLTHGNVDANLRAIERPYRRWDRRVGWLVRRRGVVTLVPLSHAYGQAVGVFLPLVMGLDVAFVATPSPAAVARALHDERAWVLMTVPRFLAALRREAESQARLSEARLRRRAELLDAPLWRRALAFLRVRRVLGLRFTCLVVGGAALDRAEEDAWSGMGYLVVQGYGLTETAPIVTLSNPFAKARGVVGKPLRGTEVRLGPDGEVLVRGANVTSGYLTRGGEAAAVDADGWLHTGDLGELDERGRLRILGRSKDVVVTAEGLNVFPRDVEAAFAGDPRVREAVVVGVPAAGGDRVHAVLLMARGGEPEAAEAVRAANARLATYQHARSWSIWPDADFPRTGATRKVRKREVLARVAPTSAGTPAGGPAPHADLRSSAATAPDPGGDAVARALASVGSARSSDEDASLADLGLSSLDAVELVARLEGDLQVVLDETAISARTTVADLRRLATSDAPAGRARAPRMPRWARTRPARWAGAALRATLAGPVVRLACRPLVVEGREHVERLDGPALIVGNHGSYLDAPVLFRALPRRLRARVAVAMATEPFGALFAPGGSWTIAKLVQAVRYALAVTAFNAFPLPRASGFRTSLAYAGELVDRGISPIVFPEGRMTTTGEMGPFRGGIGILARELRVPVLPFRIRGLHEALPPGSRRPRGRRVVVRFGPALPHDPSLPAEAHVARAEAAVRAL